MQQEKAFTAAAIDIGSNSIEVVVAHCTPEHLDILQDESAMVRLGESVKATGEITPEKRDAALAVLRKYQALADEHGADPILAVATEAVREARNRDTFLEDIRRETGLQANVISGITEAALTFYGATSGPGIPPDAGVLDVGGGSTELITAQQKHITWLTSIPIGSGWLHDQYLFSDPPAQDEAAKAQDFLRKYIQGIGVPQPPPALIVTGSSAKSLLKLARQALKVDATSDRLTRKDLLGCLGLLQALQAEDIAQRYGQELERAKVLPGGALLMLAMMEYLHLDEIRVSNHGLREGILLAYARYGEHWLDNPEVRLDDSRQGKAPPLPAEASRVSAREKTYAQAGREELPKRAKKFLSWRSKVAKSEDVEAVHKMRVASRRLRAAMDAYEVACKRKPFKKAYRSVKKAADLLGVVRDTDVMMQHINEQLEQASSEEKAGMQWFIDRLSAHHDKQQQELAAFLRNFDGKAFRQKIKSCIPKGAANGKS
jgi:exopolyphosphatase/pppGpp-phosphohydrolase